MITKDKTAAKEIAELETKAREVQESIRDATAEQAAELRRTNDIYESIQELTAQQIRLTSIWIWITLALGAANLIANILGLLLRQAAGT